MSFSTRHRWERVPWVKRMKHNVLLVGVGGMGILTASHLIANAAIVEDKNVIMSEIHGLAQRGGVVYTMVRIGNVSSPLIKEGTVDTMIALEATECLRYLNTLSTNGTILVNENIVVPPIITASKGELIPLSKIKEELQLTSKKVAFIPGLKIANELGNSIVQNVVLLGAFFSSPNTPLEEESGKKAITNRFKSMSEKVLDLNLEAFTEGVERGKDLFM